MCSAGPSVDRCQRLTFLSVGTPTFKAVRCGAERSRNAQSAIRRLEAFGPLPDRDKRALELATKRTRRMDANCDLVHEGDRPAECQLILQGDPQPASVRVFTVTTKPKCLGRHIPCQINGLRRHEEHHRPST